MSRVKNKIASLKNADAQVLACFSDGPKRTGELLERLGYSGTNFYMTQLIGDHAGEWDDSPHQLAQSDLIDSGELVWWRDSKLDVWYGLPEQCPYSKHGDDSPICRRITTYLDKVCRLSGAAPRSSSEGPLLFSAPYLTVREIDKGQEETVSVDVNFDKGKGMVRLSEYDFVVGAGPDGSLAEFPYPKTSPEVVAKKVRKILKV